MSFKTLVSTLAILNYNSNKTFIHEQLNGISIKLIWDRQTKIALIELILQLKVINDLRFYASVMNQKHVMIHFIVVIRYWGSFF